MTEWPAAPSRKPAPLFLVLAFLLAFAVFIGTLVINQATPGTVVLVVVLSSFVFWAGSRLARPVDGRWLGLTIATAYLTKLIASGARYWVLINLYRGVGDASGYHNKGLNIADIWRSLQIPEIGTGTEFVPPATGFLYAFYKPSMLGGFIIFATLAFAGQLFLYSGFRHTTRPQHLKWFALAIFFSPSIVYWPSSIGKEALIFLFLGPAAYGAARLMMEYRLRWGVVFAVGLAGIGLVRAHISLLLAGALLVVLVLARPPRVPAATAKRLVMLLVAGGVLAMALVATSQRFGLDLSAGISADLVSEELDPFLDEISDRTDRGGSAVSGGAIASVTDIPEATLRVLFSPLPWETSSAQTLAASFEGAALLALILIRSPWIISNLFRRIRALPFALFSLAFTAAFVYGFSAILNLGILSRQRSQVMPFLLALLVETVFRNQAASYQGEGRDGVDQAVGSELEGAPV
ncbi:MAG: hypothetical protein ACRDWA_09010 [Acidimicrobiia bacterium]